MFCRTRVRPTPGCSTLRHCLIPTEMIWQLRFEISMKRLLATQRCMEHGKTWDLPMLRQTNGPTPPERSQSSQSASQIQSRLHTFMDSRSTTLEALVKLRARSDVR